LDEPGEVGKTASAPASGSASAPALVNELKALATQYTRGDNTAKTMASERDRLALQAQSAIIGLKDAQLQMEQAISAGRFACAKLGKVLETEGEAWRCVAPKPEPKPEPKEIPKK
jgi:hypothetical protein